MSSLKTFREDASALLDHLQESRRSFYESEVEAIRRTALEIKNHKGDSRQWLLFSRNKVKECLESWQDQRTDRPTIQLDDFMHQRVMTIGRFLSLADQLLISSEGIRDEVRLNVSAIIVKSAIGEFLTAFKQARDEETTENIRPHFGEGLYEDPRPTRRYNSEELGLTPASGAADGPSPSELEIDRMIKDLE